MKISVLDAATLGLPDAEWEPVRKLGKTTLFERTPYQTDDIVARANDAQIILTNKVPLRAETLARLPELKMIGVLATGYNIIDIKAARERGMTVCNVPAYGTNSVAQHAVALMLELCNNSGLHHQSVMAGDWIRSPEFSYWKKPLVELTGLTVGIVGFGNIGRRVGEIVHALDAKVLAYDVAAKNPPAYQPFAWAGVEEIFATSDIVTLHCPQTAENQRFVNSALLRKMKPSAFLINTSRGGLVDEAALAEALNNETIAGAAVDVIETEPMPPTCPLLKAKNIIITPHVAWSSLRARRRILQITAGNIAGFLQGRPSNVV